MSNRLLIELIKRFRQYDMSVFSLIYDQFKGLVIYYSKKIANEDAVQDLTVFLLELLYDIVLENFPNDNSAGLQRYIAVSLRNKYIYLSREEQKHSILCNELYENGIFYNEDTEENLSVLEALNTLSQKQRLVTVYKYIYNYSDREISQMLNISRQAVNRLKNRSLESLKEFYTSKK